LNNVVFIHLVIHFVFLAMFTWCYCSVNFDFISGELHGMFSILIT
jgi:uncharacterized membrane protein YwzB